MISNFNFYNSFSVHSYESDINMLHGAINLTDSEKLILFSKYQFLINSRDGDLFTPLHIAIIEKKTDMALRLIELGADISALTKTGASPLIMAASRNQFTVCRAILEKDSMQARFCRESDQLTSLHAAVKILQPSVEIINLLCEHGADINAIYLGMTVLDYCLENEKAKASSIPVCLRLIELGGRLSFKIIAKMMRECGNTPECAINNLKIIQAAHAKNPFNLIEALTSTYEPKEVQLLLLIKQLRDGGVSIPMSSSSAWQGFLTALKVNSAERVFVELLNTVILNQESLLRENGHEIRSLFNELSSQFSALNMNQILYVITLPQGRKYLQLMEQNGAITLKKKLIEIFCNTSLKEKLEIGTIIQGAVSNEFLGALIKGLLEKHIDPFSYFSKEDNRCLLRIYLDHFAKCGNAFIKDSVYLSNFIARSFSDTRAQFDGLGILEYKMQCCLSKDIPSLFKFALQAVSIENGDFIYDISNPESTVSSMGSYSREIYPFIALYAEKFLLRIGENGFSNQDIREIIRILLYNSLNSCQTSHLMNFYQNHHVTLLVTGYQGHAFPVVFFKLGEKCVRAIPNRGGGRFKKSLSIHEIDESKLSEPHLKKNLESHAKSRYESLQFLFNLSLKELDADGTINVAVLASELLSKKDQKMPNCQTVGAKAAFELLVTAKKLRQVQTGLEKILKEVNHLYKWFSLYTSIGAMNDLFAAVGQVGQFFDFEVEETIRRKIETKFQRLENQFKEVPAFIREEFSNFIKNSNKFRKIFPLDLMQLRLSQLIPTKAIKEGDFEAVKAWTMATVNINTKNAQGNTALHEAILQKQEAIALFLCDQGLDLSLINQKGETPFIMAIIKNQRNIIEKLIEIDPQCINSGMSKSGRFYSALYFAFIRGDKNLVECLLYLGANPSEAIVNLKFPTIEKNQYLFKRLIEEGADIFAKDRQGNSFVNFLYDDLLNQLDVHMFKNGHFLNTVQTQSYYIERLQLLLDLGVKWNDSLVAMTQKAWELTAVPSLLLNFIRENSFKF